MTFVKSLLTIRQFSQKHPVFSENSIRWHVHLVRSKQESCFTNALIWVGKRVLIDEEAFFKSIVVTKK